MLPLQMNTVAPEIKPSWITEKEKLAEDEWKSQRPGHCRGIHWDPGAFRTQRLCRVSGKCNPDLSPKIHDKK